MKIDNEGQQHKNSVSDGRRKSPLYKMLGAVGMLWSGAFVGLDIGALVTDGIQPMLIAATVCQIAALGFATYMVFGD